MYDVKVMCDVDECHFARIPRNFKFFSCLEGKILNSKSCTHARFITDISDVANLAKI